MPIISIIIPAYNVAGYIEKCIESMTKQTMKDIEIIIVNDGSTDKTGEICDRYASADSRIHVIHKENQGVSVARNTGIEKARGEYILFYDGDDFVEPYTCEELYKMAQENKVDTILYGYHRINNGKVFETSPPIFEEAVYESNQIIETILPRFIGISGNAINNWLNKEEKALHRENAALWRAMVSSKIIKENKLRFNKNLKVGEDTIFITEYLSYSKSCYVSHKCYYYLVTRETSTIYVYEQKPLAKLEGKTKLLRARSDLSNRLNKRLSQNVRPHWQGTVVMSVIELAFLLSKKHPQYKLASRFKAYKEYCKNTEVKKVIKDIEIKPKMVPMYGPFLLLKCRCFGLLFMAAGFMNLINYEFDRG